MRSMRGQLAYKRPAGHYGPAPLWGKSGLAGRVRIRMAQLASEPITSVATSAGIGK